MLFLLQNIGLALDVFAVTTHLLGVKAKLCLYSTDHLSSCAILSGAESNTRWFIMNFFTKIVSQKTCVLQETNL